MDEPIEVVAVDHIYVAVSDMARAEAFYDPVMRLLGFKKGTMPIAGDPHIHYFNRVTQYTLRLGRGGQHDPYRTGALHHLCFRVRTRDDVARAWQRLCEAGVDATEPRVYEYRPDYYATFFEDPDGVRLEIVCDTSLRKTLRARWSELLAFENPVSKLGAAAAAVASGNLHAKIPAELPEELVEMIARSPDARVERIVSRGHSSPEGFWYDQDEHEIVVVISGAARLEFEKGEGPATDLGPGDWLHLPPHCRHRVAWTSPAEDTIWLAVFWPA